MKSLAAMASSRDRRLTMRLPIQTHSSLKAGPRLAWPATGGEGLRLGAGSASFAAARGWPVSPYGVAAALSPLGVWAAAGGAEKARTAMAAASGSKARFM